MFESLYTYQGVLRRHGEGPLAAERAAYLADSTTLGLARGTLLRRATYCRCVAIELGRWPPDHLFDEVEVDALASAWATARVACGWATSQRWPEDHFRLVANDFLRWLGRLRPAPPPVVRRYDAQLADFIAAQQEGPWQSEATCQSAKWQIGRFLDYLEQRGVALADTVPEDLDAYFRHMSQRWSRGALATSAKALRAWFTYCETRCWVQHGLAAAILLPRIYRHEGLPLGPTWEEVGRLLSDTAGDDPASTRDHAILLLLSVYALRSGEVRRLRLDDINWQDDRLRVVRSKSGREESLPLEPRVGNAVARYLRDGRPKSDSRAVFLTLCAPHRPLSAGGLYHVVAHRLARTPLVGKGRGPHGLRHACARHLVEGGRSFKEVGDHLGHRNPDAIRVYAKVDLVSLRRVAFDSLGGLA